MIASLILYTMLGQCPGGFCTVPMSASFQAPMVQMRTYASVPSIQMQTYERAPTVSYEFPTTAGYSSGGSSGCYSASYSAGSYSSAPALSSSFQTRVVQSEFLAPAMSMPVFMHEHLSSFAAGPPGFRNRLKIKIKSRY